MAKKTIKILAIDDHSDNLVVLKALVNDSFPDAAFFAAESGKKGFELCQSEKPDVVLLDIVMPGMDGYEVCSKIKSDLRLKHIPVIMVTANRADKESRVKALETGADAFLPKPVDESELKAQIKAMLRIKESEDLKKEEKQRLENMVLDRTEALENELADRKKAENKLIQSLDKILKSRQAILNLMEDLKVEIEERKNIEKSLKEERNLLRTVIDNIHDTIYVFDKDCRKIIANKADLEITGCESEAEVLGKTDLEVYPGDEGKRFFNESMVVIKTGKPKIDSEEKFIGKNGEIIYLTTTQYPLYDTDGQIIGLVGIGHDITKRRRAEKELEVKNRELEFLFNVSSELSNLSPTANINEFLAKKLKEYSGAVLAVSLDYITEKKALQIKHIETNLALLNKANKILGKSFFEKATPVAPENLDFILHESFAMSKSLKDLSFGQISDFTDKALKSVTGIDRYYAIASVLGNEYFGTTMLGFREGAPAPGKELLVSFARVAAATIQRRKYEEKLKDSEERYRLLIENQGEGVGVVNLEEKFVFANPAAEEMFGVGKGGLLNRNLLDFIDPEFVQVIEQETKRRLRAEKSNYEINIIRPNREKRTLLITATPQLTKEGKLSGTFGVFRDITERKIAEYELIKSKEKAEESDRLKTAFLHNISHEIRTPMNAIIGFSALLNEPDLDKESQNSYIEIITQSSNHLLSIVNDIIEISNIEAGILKLNIKRSNINSIIHNVYNQFISKALEKKMELHLEAGFNDEAAQLLTDEPKLTEILSGLLSNAVKFTSSGKITLGYCLKEKFIEFYVKDTGIGISHDQFKKIFDRFYQVENSISRQYEGTGLGLSIAKAYVELLGGSIWLTSEPGSGSTFFFTIPYSGVETSAIPGQKVIEKDKGHSLDNKTILIAEDEENNFKLVVELLANLNLKIIHAENGREAVEKCKSMNEIDLVLMDIKMPVMDGYEATSILKKLRPDLPIIAQTAFAFESDREKVFNAGCDDYLSKPIKKDLLIEMVKKYL